MEGVIVAVRNDLPQWCPVRCGKVPSHGRAPADQAPSPITPVVRMSASTTRDRPSWWMPGAAAVDPLPR